MVQKSGINSPVEEKLVEIPLFFNGFIDPKGALKSPKISYVASRNLNATQNGYDPLISDPYGTGKNHLETIDGLRNSHVGVSKKRGHPQNGWFIMEKPIKLDG